MSPILKIQVRIQRGGQGVGPPLENHVTWVYIGNKQLDPPPPPPGKSWTPPGKCWTPSGTLKNDRFLWSWPFDFFKISWGLKKRCQSFFCQTDLDPPWRKFLDPRMRSGACCFWLCAYMCAIKLNKVGHDFWTTRLWSMILYTSALRRTRTYIWKINNCISYLSY